MVICEYFLEYVFRLYSHNVMDVFPGREDQAGDEDQGCTHFYTVREEYVDVKVGVSCRVSGGTFRQPLRDRSAGRERSRLVTRSRETSPRGAWHIMAVTDEP